MFVFVMCAVRTRITLLHDLPLFTVGRELVALTSFRKEVAESNWTEFHQKIKVLAEKEATSRATLWDYIG